MAKKQQARKSAVKKSSGGSSAARAKAVAPTGKASKSLKAATGTRYVYLFGRKTDGNGTMKPLLGGKGANLAEMGRIGLPVPPGFTITTEVCTYYYASKRTYPSALRAQMEAGMRSIAQQSGKKVRDLKNPLLVPVRQSA